MHVKPLHSKSGAEAQMLQCFKNDLNLKRKMIRKMEASGENFKECISKMNKTIEGIGTAITQRVQLLSQLVKVSLRNFSKYESLYHKSE